ncbi:MAG TPA: tRNA(Ile)(2)-agmatinylcytidine synthase [Nitrososphaerales archaeon]|nr:tRNA(Ile)(2)-agmatinylcytidine synthase [Nitrososphaerales archaeon]
MRCLVGIDDTDSSRGFCTTYLAYRIAVDLRPEVEALPYPRLVRLNPNVPFKTRGNAAVCLQIETSDPEGAFERICGKLAELSDVEGGANSGLVFLADPSQASKLEPLYSDALSGLVSPHKVRRLLRSTGARSFELGNGMGVVGAASSLGFAEHFDHTYELIAYRRKEYWGTRRMIDASSVKEMDDKTFPHTFNNYDYQKRKVLIAPHGPDPVFMGIRGDTPQTVLGAFALVAYDEPLQGHMVYVSNQHTDAHLRRELRWKAYSSGWCDCTVAGVEVGAGGHVYLSVNEGRVRRLAAAYEPTADLRRTVKLLQSGDRVRLFGGVRRPTSLHPKVLNLEKFELIAAQSRRGPLEEGTYISSPRANRHLTKPLIRYGRENQTESLEFPGWLSPVLIRPRARARSR